MVSEFVDGTGWDDGTSLTTVLPSCPVPPLPSLPSRQYPVISLELINGSLYAPRYEKAFLHAGKYGLPGRSIRSLSLASL